MAKRFTDTDKWGNSDFYKLSPTAKLVFIYITDNCNNAGFYDLNETRLSSDIGISPSQIDTSLQEIGNACILRGGTIWVRTFLKQQKNVELNPLNNAHKQIIELLLEDAHKFIGIPEFDLFVSKLPEEVKNKVAFLAPDLGLISPIGKGKVKVQVTDSSLKGGVGENFLNLAPAELLGVPEFEEAWGEWVRYRKRDLKKPVKESTAKEQFKFLKLQPNPVAVIRESIRNTWQGLFPEKTITAKQINATNPNSVSARLSYDGEQADESLRKLGERILAKSAAVGSSP